MKNFWKYLFLFVLYAMINQEFLIAQNLVPNGSFEQQYSCPNNTGQVDSCIGWHKFGGIFGAAGTPDYFDSCSIAFVGVPDNIFGTQEPFAGHAYMGMYTFDYSYWYREIIGTKLIDTLIPGNSYLVSMRVSRGNRTIDQTDACVASNKMGLRFTTFGYPIGSIIPIDNYVQVYSDSMITDTLNWVLLNWNFTPDSFYTHIYIGNFFESANTDTIQINCPIPPGRAYYFIDSVNIVCTSSNCFMAEFEIRSNEPEIFYNSINESLNLKNWNIKKSTLFMFNEIGQMVLKKPIESESEINISSLDNKFYIAVLRSANKTVYKKIIKY